MPALCSDDGTRMTYGELRGQAEEIGAWFCRDTFAGSPADARCLVFCMCENSPGAVIGYLGMLESGAVPLLLDADLEEEQFAAFFDRYRPTHIWLPAGKAGRLKGLPARKLCETRGYCLYRTDRPLCPAHRDLALLLATSGSTGSPRLVRVSRKNLESNAAAIARYLKLDASARPVTTLPMHYTYGLSVINSHLLAGACVLLTGQSCVQNGFWEFFGREQANSLSGVPYTYEMLKKLRVFEGELPSLKCLTQAGGKLPEDLQRLVSGWAARQGVDFYIMYGQTEATARMGYLPPEKSGEKIGSIGIPIPGGSFSLVDESGREINAPDEVGELVYRGDNVTLGYASSREDLVLGDERGGVLYTGDLARRDADGYYYIAGRKKRFIKMYGVRVALDACEQILRRRFPRAEFACAGEDGCLRIYAAGETDEAEAADYLASYLRLNRRGFRGIRVPEIPKNAAGKVQYGRLEQEASARGK